MAEETKVTPLNPGVVEEPKVNTEVSKEEPRKEEVKIVGGDGKVLTPEQIKAKEDAEAAEIAQKAENERIAKEAKEKEEANKLTKKAPDKYDDFVLPKGIVLDSAIGEIAIGVFKEFNLSQEQAQKLIDLNILAMQRQREQNEIEFTAQKKAWLEESKSRYGTELESQLQYAGRTLDMLGSPGLRQILSDSGLEYHPDLLDFCIKAGKSLSPDTFVIGKKGNGEGELKTGPEALYPNQGQN